jgi:hypothetical protein
MVGSVVRMNVPSATWNESVSRFGDCSANAAGDPNRSKATLAHTVLELVRRAREVDDSWHII